MIRAILFDQGNTLIDYSLQGKWRQFLPARLAELHPLACREAGAVALPPEDFAAKAAAIIGERGRLVEQTGRAWPLADRLEEAFAAVGLEAGREFLRRFAEAFYEPIRACTSPYPETAAALATLQARGLRLAVITNAPWDAPARLVRGDLERWGLAAPFWAYVCSGDVPWRKPNPEFMLAAARALGVEPGECLVVGDTWGTDVAGALAAGMRAVWVNAGGRPIPEGQEKPYGVVATVGDIPSLL